MTRTHASYRYLCAPSNPIATELFGDDLPRVVKDITLILTPTELPQNSEEIRKRVKKEVGNMNAMTNFRGKGAILGQKNYNRLSLYKGKGKKKVQKSQS